MTERVLGGDGFRAVMGLRLLESAFERPAAEALEVIAELSLAGPQPSLPIAELRRRYRMSRRPLLAPFESVDSVTHIASPGEGVPPLTLVRPRCAVAGVTIPAIVYLHGGGWCVGDLGSYEPFCRQLANALNATIIYVDYRLAPEHPFPAAFNDTRSALAWVRRNAGHLMIDPGRIGIGGDSAGGNLAAAACIAAREAYETPLWIQILIYPALDMLACLASHQEFSEGYLLTADLYAWYRRNYVGGFSKPGHWRLSPLFIHDPSGLPPAVILYAGFDPLRDEAIAYADRMRRAGVAVECIGFSDMIHGFMTMGGRIPAAAAGVARIAQAVGTLTAP